MKSGDISAKCYELGALLQTCRSALENVESGNSAIAARQIGAVQTSLEVAERILDEIHGPFDMGDDFEVPPVQKEAAQ